MNKLNKMEEDVLLNIQEEHLEDLQGSGLNKETLLREKERVFSVDRDNLEKKLGFSLPKSKDYSGLEFRYNEKFSRFKIFPPVQFKEGEKPKKYLQPKETGVSVFWPEKTLKEEFEKDPDLPIMVVEGEKKALKGYQENLPIFGLGGIWNWKAKGSDKPIQEIIDIPLLNRPVLLIPDSDWIQKHGVMLAVYRLGFQLKCLGAKVRVANLDIGSSKCGLDDYLVKFGIERFNSFVIPRAIGLEHPIFKDNGLTKLKVKREIIDNTPKPIETVKGLPPLSGKAGNIRRIIFDDLGYKFRFNVVLNCVEYQDPEIKENKWFQAEDRAFNKMVEKVREFEGFEDFSETRLFKMVNSDLFSKKFDPFVDFFERNIWDGKERLIDLWRTLEVENPENLPLFLRWFVNAVPCMLGLNKNENCLVFHGKMGIYKTTWLNNLFLDIPDLENYQSAEKSVDPHSPDFMRMLSENGLINLDEFKCDRSKIDQVNFLFSKETIVTRFPYDRFKTRCKRRANFTATVNNLEFIADDNGSRRWFPFKIKSIDWEMRNKIDMKQVWAEAYHNWKTGDRYWLNQEEIQQLNEKNEEFQEITVEEELVRTKLIPPERVGDHSDNWHTATEVSKFLLDGKSEVRQGFKIMVGKALNKAGYKFSKRGGCKKYLVSLDSHE